MPSRKDRSTVNKPSPVRAGRLIAYAHRPPIARDPRWAWRVVVYEDNRQRTIRGAGGRATIDEITAQLGRIIVERGVDGADIVQAGPERSGDVDHLLRAWLTEQKAAAARPAGAGITALSYSSYRDRGRVLTEQLGHLAPEQLLQRGVLQQHVDALSDRYAARSVHNYVGALRNAWNAGVAAGRVSGVLPRLQLPARDEDSRVNNHTAPTRAQCRAILVHYEAASRHARTRYRYIACELLAATGARPSEIGALRWKDVDMDAGEVVLRGKTGRRVIGLAPRALAVLKTWKAGREPVGRMERVLGVPMKRLRSGGFREALAELGPAAGFPDLVIAPYSFRRMVSWRLLSTPGMDPVRYQEIMGHSWEQGLKDYARSTPQARAAAMTLLDLDEGEE